MKTPYIDPLTVMKLESARGIIKNIYTRPTIEQYNRAVAQKSYAGAPIEVREVPPVPKNNIPVFEFGMVQPIKAKVAAPKVKPGQINLKKEINKKIIFTPAPKKVKAVKRAAAPKTKAKPTPKKKVVKNIKKVILKKKSAPVAKKKNKR